MEKRHQNQRRTTEKIVTATVTVRTTATITITATEAVVIVVLRNIEMIVRRRLDLVALLTAFCRSGPSDNNMSDIQYSGMDEDDHSKHTLDGALNIPHHNIP